MPVTDVIKFSNSNFLAGGWIRGTGFLLESGGTAVLPSAMGHLHEKVYEQNASCPSATDAIAVIHVVHGASGSVLAFKAGIVVAGTGDSTISVDLKKNGTSVLSAPISITATKTAYEITTATITTTSLAAGDVLTVVATVSEGSGTLPYGLFASVALTEDYPV